MSGHKQTKGGVFWIRIEMTKSDMPINRADAEGILQDISRYSQVRAASMTSEIGLMNLIRNGITGATKYIN